MDPGTLAHAHAGHAGGNLDFWDVLALRCEAVVAKIVELVRSSRDQKHWGWSWASVASVASQVASMGLC